MRYKLMATTAVLAFTLGGPVFAQSTDQGVRNPGATERPQHHEQDQGIKTGQNEKTNAGSAQEGSSSKASESTAKKTDEHNQTKSTSSKPVAQPEENKDRANTGDRKENRASEDKGNERDRRAGESSDSTKKQSMDRDRPDDKQRASDRNNGQDRDRNTANQNDRRDSRANESRSDRTKSVSLDQKQQTRISASIRSAKVKPLSKVNFSIRVGVRVPTSVHLYTLPADVIEIVPEYRGYSYFVVEDQIVIVEPDTHEIVTTVAYSGSSGRADRAQRRSSRLSDSDRKAIRSRTNSTEHKIITRRYEIGEQVPADVDDYDFPETVYTEVPSVRSYRYIPRERGGVVLIEPRERRVIDVID